MDFFVYSRDAAGADALRDDEELLEEHWSYMDGFAGSMIARGPTLTADRQRATGSLHVLGLPDVDAVHEFVAREPNNRAGVYADHSIWRFEDLLGRTMWEFEGAADEAKYLIVARTIETGYRPVAPEAFGAALEERMILYGALSTLDGSELIGFALALQAPDRHSLGAGKPWSAPEFVADIHDWEPGGRR